MNEEEEMKEAMSSLPEAPVSITVRGYYKGFSVLITKRNAEGRVELDEIIEAVNNMVLKGFKPSWNEQTNGEQIPIEAKMNLPVCTIHNKEMKERTSPDGSIFHSHSFKTKEGNWLYCSGKGFVK